VIARIANFAVRQCRHAGSGALLVADEIIAFYRLPRRAAKALARHAFMTTLCCTSVIVALTLPIIARAGETTLAAVLSDPAGFDGRKVQVRGTLTDLKAHRARKGYRYHTFTLSDDVHAVLILVLERPGCAGSPVTVNGAVQRRRAGPGPDAVVIEATTVTCLARTKSRSDASAAFADDRHAGSYPESGQPRKPTAK